MTQSPAETETSIALAASMQDFFHEAVDEAIRARGAEASAAAHCYLVNLLCDFGRPDEEVGSVLEEPVTILLHEAISSTGRDRLRKLRVVGDGVLYALGFFSERAEIRGKDRAYMAQVGSSAYDHAAAMLRVERAGPAVGAPDVLTELSHRFESFVDVLQHIAHGAMAHGARNAESVVRLYERWLRTGSTAMASALSQQGLVPTRGEGGVH